MDAEDLNVFITVKLTREQYGALHLVCGDNKIFRSKIIGEAIERHFPDEVSYCRYCIYKHSQETQKLIKKPILPKQGRGKK